LLLPLLVFSQEINSEKDSIPKAIKNPYIENHHKQLNIKFDITNDRINYGISIEDKKASIRTNLKTSYGFVFSYKFASVRLGVRPGLSENEKINKGESDVFRFRIKLLFDNWTHKLEYNYHRGFYIENSQDIFPIDNNTNFHIQFPHLTTNIFTGTSQYKLNKNFSFKAIQSNTEIQLKNAGTFMPGINYTYYDVTGADKIKNEDNEIIQREEYSDYNGFSVILNAGYYYTFVTRYYWYINMYANPGIGIDFYKTTFYTASNSSDQSFNETFFSLNSGVAVGYNGKKYYFGFEFNYQVSSEVFDDNNISLQPKRSNFHVFVGYRFKAPKQIAKPIDLIEEKIPILKDDN